MDSEFDYSQYYYRPQEKKSKVKIGRFLIIIFIATCFIFACVVFSKKAEEGAYVSVDTKKNVINVHEANFYAVRMLNAESEGAAQSFSESVKARGGAGYVYKNDANYYVLACMYMKKEDSTSVIESLNQTGSKCDEFIITVPNVKISYAANGNFLNAAYEVVNNFYVVVQDLYDISIKLDKDEITVDQARVKIKDRRNKSKELIEKYDDVTLSSNFGTMLNSAYVKMYRIYDELLALNVAKIVFSGELKYQSINVLCGYINLLNSVKK